jgi:DNA repair protein RecO (recombination protein O)
VRALVIKEFEAGEADKRLLLLCKEHGRLLVYARGARKPKSKFLSSAQIFTYSDFVLAQGRGFFSVTQADIIENFYDLRTDYDRLAAAFKIVNICDKTVLENSNCDPLLRLVLKSLSLLAKKSIPHSQVLSVFLLRFFDYYGLRPHSQECSVCGASSAFDDLGESGFWGCEGLICERCAKSQNFDIVSVSESAIKAIGHILESELSLAFGFVASERVLGELEAAADLMWKFHFGM